MSFSVRTQAYSGPFDLLLQLVSRQKVAIGSISISEVADQYLDEVSRMGDVDLDVASDFLLVASTLLDIKAASLVPADGAKPKDAEDDDGDGDLDGLSPDEAREVLIARLIAYKQFRNAAAALAARQEAEGRMHPRTAGPDPEFLNLMPDYLEGITLRSLAVICADLDSRRQSFLLDAEHVAPRRMPIALTVASVDRQTQAHPETTFTELVGQDTRVENVVATFLAILELCKLGSITLSQAELFGEIDIERVAGAAPYELEASDLVSIEETAIPEED